MRLLFFFLIVGGIAAVFILMTRLRRKARRRQALQQPFSDDWIQIPMPEVVWPKAHRLRNVCTLILAKCWLSFHYAKVTEEVTHPLRRRRFDLLIQVS